MILQGALKTIGNQAFVKCNKVKRVEIPNNINIITIGALAFMGCASLREVILLCGIMEIGNGLFLHCINLATVHIPCHVKMIGIEAFQLCKNMKSLVLLVGLKYILAHAFSSSGLVKAIIPKGVVEIKIGVFQNCTS